MLGFVRMRKGLDSMEGGGARHKDGGAIKDVTRRKPKSRSNNLLIQSY